MGTIASIDNQKKNYVIFLTSNDLESLENISFPIVHDKSFLYSFYEQNNANVSVEGIYSIFTPSFGQNIVLMIAFYRENSTGYLFEWPAYRLVLHRCTMTHVIEYQLAKVSQCCGPDEFNTFPLMSTSTASCPVQAAGLHRPPFTFYDPIRGFYNGFKYHLVRQVMDHMQWLLLM